MVVENSPHIHEDHGPQTEDRVEHQLQDSSSFLSWVRRLGSSNAPQRQVFGGVAIPQRHVAQNLQRLTVMMGTGHKLVLVEPLLETNTGNSLENRQTRLFHLGQLPNDRTIPSTVSQLGPDRNNHTARPVRLSSQAESEDRETPSSHLVRYHIEKDGTDELTLPPGLAPSVPDSTASGETPEESCREESRGAVSVPPNTLR